MRRDDGKIRGLRPAVVAVLVAALVAAVTALASVPSVAGSSPARMSGEGESTLRALADGGGDGQAAYVEEAHDGNFSRTATDAETGPEGSASVSVSQENTASETLITSHGEASGSSTTVDAEADLWNLADLRFTPAETGTWELTVDASSSGDDCLSGTLQFGQVGGPYFINRVVDCDNSPYSDTMSFTIEAGTSYLYGFTVMDDVNDGSGAFEWDLRLERTSVDEGLTNLDKPKVTGAKRVGKTVKATSGEWSGDPASYAYQWLRNGKKIDGADGTSYKLRKADQGDRVSVRVTARKPGADPVSATSKAHKVKPRS